MKMPCASNLGGHAILWLPLAIAAVLPLHVFAQPEPMDGPPGTAPASSPSGPSPQDSLNSEIARCERDAARCEEKGDFQAAVEWRRQVVKAAMEGPETLGWKVAEARAELALAESMATATPVKRQQLATLRQLEGRFKVARNAGRYKEAVAIAQEAWHVARDMFGKDDPHLASAAYRFGRSYTLIGDDARAEPLLRESLAIRGSRHPDLHREMSFAMALLGKMNTRQGRLDDAWLLLTEALRVFEQTLGRNDAEYGLCFLRLGDVLYARHDFMGAVRYYELAADSHKAVSGDTSVAYALALLDVGRGLRGAGQYAKAIAPHEESVERLRGTLGERHALYAGALSMLGQTYAEAGELARAQLIQQEAVSACRAAYGESSPFHAMSLHNLGLLYRQLGQSAAAKPLLEESVKIFRAARHADPMPYLNSLGALGCLLAEMGEIEQARAMFDEAQSELPMTSIRERLPAFMLELGAFQVLDGDLDGAETVLVGLVESRAASLGDSHPQYANSVRLLADLRTAQGRWKESEGLLVAALSVSESTLGKMHPQVAKCLDSYARLLRLDDRPDEADAVSARADEIRKHATARMDDEIGP